MRMKIELPLQHQHVDHLVETSGGVADGDCRTHRVLKRHAATPTRQRMSAAVAFPLNAPLIL
ncbi:hypothetical protein ACC753_37775, partial [Rhizobium ruizarguesonis]